MNKKILTEAEYKRIVRESCENPLGHDVIVADKPNLTERDYLHAVWYRLAKYLGSEMPMLPPKDGRSDIEVLRDEIHRLVSEHQSTNYDIQPTLYRYIRTALPKNPLN